MPDFASQPGRTALNVAIDAINPDTVVQATRSLSASLIGQLSKAEAAAMQELLETGILDNMSDEARVEALDDFCHQDRRGLPALRVSHGGFEHNFLVDLRIIDAMHIAT